MCRLPLEYVRWMMRYYHFVYQFVYLNLRGGFCLQNKNKFPSDFTQRELFRAAFPFSFAALNFAWSSKWRIHSFRVCEFLLNDSDFWKHLPFCFRSGTFQQWSVSKFKNWSKVLEWMNEKAISIVHSIIGVDILLSSNYSSLSPFKIFTWKSVDGIIKSLFTA